MFYVRRGSALTPLYSLSQLQQLFLSNCVQYMCNLIWFHSSFSLAGYILKRASSGASVDWLDLSASAVAWKSAEKAVALLSFKCPEDTNP